MLENRNRFKMISSIILATSVFGATLPSIASANEQVSMNGTIQKSNVESKSTTGMFQDVPTQNWAYKEITELAKRDIINGYPNRLFKPAYSIRRDHVALILSNALDLKAIKPAKDFNDIPKNSSYYKVIQELQRAGIFEGDKKGYFNPEKSITRAEMAKVMVDAFDIPMTNKGQMFTDVPPTHWANKYIQALSNSGITVGNGDGKMYKPQDTINRAQFAVFLYRALKIE